jgi:hypothetical protein
MQNALFLLPFLALAPGAADRPDFSGTWKERLAANSGSSRVERITQRDSALQIVAEAHSDFGRLRGGIYSDTSYTTDGTERAGTDRQGREHWVSASWQGDALVFLRIDKEDCHVTVTRDTWTLSPSGTTLTRTRRAIGPKGLTEETRIFDKQ